MRLDDIGFYTLSDQRVLNASATSPLWRCELIVTDRCTFCCPYCRGLCADIRGDLPADQAWATVDVWLKNGLKNVRFTGGEPTLYDELPHLVRACRKAGVERIAVSTNGYADFSVYQDLIDYGVNDFSVSLDGGCCSLGERMSGGVRGSWDKVVANIKELARQVYVTVGMVFTDENVDECLESVVFVDSLGVSDIRVIPSAQYNKALDQLAELPDELLSKYKVLRYRIDNLKNGRGVRGLGSSDCSRCRLVLDDMAVAQGYHFPCIIYLREGGDPIGRMSGDVRAERAVWSEEHDTKDDLICSRNCLDVCVDYNNRRRDLSAGAS